MKRVHSILLLFIAFCLPAIAFPQNSDGFLSLDGSVYGYNYDYSKKLLKKEKQIKVEGALDNVLVIVRENGVSVKEARTNANGLFYLQIKTGRTYSVEFSKPGYSSVLMNIDLTAVPKDVAMKGVFFSGAEMLMNSFQSKTKSPDPSIGKLYFNLTGNYLDFEENKAAPKKQKEYIENSASLMLRAVEKNRNNASAEATLSDPSEAKAPTRKNMLQVQENGQDRGVMRSDSARHSSGLLNGTPLKVAELNDNNLAVFETDLKNARLRLQQDKLNARTREDSLLLQEREHVLNAMEAQLSGAKKIIELQESKISSQNQLLILAIVSVSLLLTLLLFIYRFNKERKKTYLLLKDKNQKITDSISYASRIQNSILPSDDEVKRLLPASFIFFQPKDVVSGDFYWVNSVKGKIVIACVDCTGHGVPGAFMSLIGNTLLNEIVQEKQITDPAQILKRLHQGILKALQQSTQSEVKDGMDISLCVVDLAEKKMSFAGAMNPVYVLKDNVITVLKPDIRSIGGVKEMDAAFEFTNHTVSIAGASVYMFTDGYMDQFGGAENKKFNIPNFKKMILDNQTKEMPEQKKVVETTIREWQGNGRQIDDMLVIGFRC